MFRSVSLIDSYVEGTQIVSYKLDDSSFEDIVKLKLNNYSKSKAALPEIIIIKGYEARGLHIQIPRSLAIYYTKFCRHILNLNHRLSEWCDMIDENFPEVEYKSKYYPCVLRQIKQISYWQKDGKKNIR